MTSERTVEVNGLMVNYREAGDGPPLVLLHGFACDSRAWRPQLEDLADQFRVIAWDAPGAGKSSDPPPRFGTDDWAACLGGFLLALNIERADVVGLSWGGILAQQFYRRSPSAVRSLVLADTYAGWKGSLPAPVPEDRLRACLRDASLPPNEFVAKYISGMFTEAVAPAVREELSIIMSEFHPDGFRLMARSSATADTRDVLKMITVPTQLIWGEGDARSPLSISQQFLAAIPGARLAVITAAGHVSNLEQPERFNNEVRRFCRSI